MSDPVGKYLSLGGLTIPVYRILIVVIAVLLFGALNFFFRKSIVGKIVVAALEDKDGVRCLGSRWINISPWCFSWEAHSLPWEGSFTHPSRRFTRTWGSRSSC